MNLHICTISSRNEHLENIYRSIPWSPDVTWHIAREVGNPITSVLVTTNSRVQVYSLTCDKTDTSFKMNYIFQQIINTDANSYFCILDDDTLFHAGMYKTYKQYRNKTEKYMVIGKQRDNEGNVRLYGTLPYECAIDSGNVLCHSHVLVPERWPDKHWTDKYHVDYDFWNRCSKHFTLQHLDIVPNTISTYNKFSIVPDTLIYKRNENE